MKKVIGVLGGKGGNCSKGALAFAEAVGAEVARRGFALVSGGYDGIMEAASRGSKEAGGMTFGILKSGRGIDANAYIDYAIPTSMGRSRNNIIILMSSGLIAFEGRYGTASEIATALDMGRPIVITGSDCILKDAALKAPNCVRHMGNDPEAAGAVVQKLCELMREAED